MWFKIKERILIIRELSSGRVLQASLLYEVQWTQETFGRCPPCLTRFFDSSTPKYRDFFWHPPQMHLPLYPESTIFEWYFRFLLSYFLGCTLHLWPSSHWEYFRIVYALYFFSDQKNISWQRPHCFICYRSASINIGILHFESLLCSVISLNSPFCHNKIAFMS